MMALLAATRAVHFASLMGIFGASAFTALLRRSNLSALSWRAERVLVAVAAMLALVSALLWFCLIAGQMSGDWRGATDPVTLALVATETRFGEISVARVVGLAALCVLGCGAVRRRGRAIPLLAGL